MNPNLFLCRPARSYEALRVLAILRAFSVVSLPEIEAICGGRSRVHAVFREILQEERVEVRGNAWALRGWEYFGMEGLRCQD